MEFCFQVLCQVSTMHWHSFKCSVIEVEIGLKWVICERETEDDFTVLKQASNIMSQIGLIAPIMYFLLVLQKCYLN